MRFDRDLIPMNEAIRYIADRSVWLKAHQDDEAWITAIQNDLVDALRMGRVAAFGRDQIYRDGWSGDAKHPPRQIRAEEWGDILPDPFNDRLQLTGCAGRRRGTRHFVIHDVHFSRGDVRRQWPPLRYDPRSYQRPWSDYSLPPRKPSRLARAGSRTKQSARFAATALRRLAERVRPEIAKLTRALTPSKYRKPS